MQDEVLHVLDQFEDLVQVNPRQGRDAVVALRQHRACGVEVALHNLQYVTATGLVRRGTGLSLETVPGLIPTDSRAACGTGVPAG